MLKNIISLIKSLLICVICYFIPILIILIYNIPISIAYVIIFFGGSLYMAIMLYNEHKQDLDNVMKRCSEILKEQENSHKETILSLNDDIQKYIKRARNAMYEVDEIKGRK